MGKFKYQRFISSLSRCPPPGCSEQQMSLFRFVRGDIQHPKNFMPPAMLNPTRRFKDDGERCSAYALSFFESAQAAQERYEGMRRKHPNIHQVLGTHLAQVAVQPEDGKLTLPRSSHLDLHEYEGSNLAARAVIVHTLHSEGAHGA